MQKNLNKIKNGFHSFAEDENLEGKVKLLQVMTCTLANKEN